MFPCVSGELWSRVSMWHVQRIPHDFLGGAWELGWRERERRVTELVERGY